MGRPLRLALARLIVMVMSAPPKHAADAEIVEGIRESLSGTPAFEDHLFEMLGYLDAGGAIHAIEAIADRVSRLRELAGSSGSSRRNGLSVLIGTCEDFAGEYGRGGRTIHALPHIGWTEVVDDASAAAGRYGFTSTGSIETFEELLRYCSGVCDRMADVTARSLEALDELSGSARRDEVRALLGRGMDGWRERRRSLDRTAETIREALAETGEFALRRGILRERATSERDEAAARLLTAIGRVLSPWAWLPASPESRLVACEASGGYRLRIAFADGLDREIELDEEYWSTTGLAIDPELFRAVRLDRERNVLVWPNGYEIPGERLHLAIREGRLGFEHG